MDNKKEIVSLSRKDWIDYGLKLLGQSGVAAVRVEPLAKMLQVTKGSFYWHFKNREALLEAIVQEWVDRETNSIIQQVENAGGDANYKLLNLFELAVQDDDATVENAIRAWATNDLKVAAVLAKVDQTRLEYTRDLFLELGFTPLEAQVRARLAYYSLVGEYTIGTHRDLVDRLTEVRLEHAILTHRP